MHDPISAPALPADSRWRRFRHTPLVDLLRGRVTGRLDLRQFVVDADLPEPLSRIVFDVVRRTRLWSSWAFRAGGEGREAAEELVAHFANGLAQGRTADELATSFGPTKKAAQQIRRTKLRSRPWPRRYFRRARHAMLLAVGVAFGLYFMALVRYIGSRPTISRDYLAEFNAPILATPKEQRAWPRYLEALEPVAGLGFAMEPGEHGWEDTLGVLQRHEDLIPKIRAAAELPTLGYVWRSEIKTNPASPTEDYLFLAMTPTLQPLRNVFYLLNADAHRAAKEGDATAVVADLRAMVSLADQLYRQGGSGIEYFVASAIGGESIETGGRILAEYPNLFDEDLLRELTHHYSTFAGGGTPEVDLSGEIAIFEDVLQRTHTDNGNQDGHITPAAIDFAYHARLSDALDRELAQFRGSQRGWIESAVENVLATGASLALASRREELELFNRWVAELQAQRQIPMWTWEELPDAETWAEKVTGTQAQLRYPFALRFMPEEAFFVVAERNALRRDALLVVLAAKAFHLEHQTWPESLEQLVPHYLPEVPPDRFDGQPLRYRIRDDRPLVYSVGSNLKDDGGNLPSAGHSPYSVSHFFPPAVVERMRAESGGTKPLAGDWVFWPPPPRTRPANPSTARANTE